MLKKVLLTEDPMSLAVKDWEAYEVKDVRVFIMERFPTWPSTLKIYHKEVAESNDVTPLRGDIAAIKRLGELEGPFYIVVWPGTGMEIAAVVIAVVAVVAAIAAAYFFRPSIPKNGNYVESSNNELSSRVNKERLFARIPDIFGTVRSTPDLLAVPYKIFENHEEVEYCLLCIGRGAYEVTDINDGETGIDNIRGSTVEIYGPYQPLYGSIDMHLGGTLVHIPVAGVPDIRIGNAINRPVDIPKRFDAVNGQSLRGVDDKSLDVRVYFTANEIHTVSGDTTTDFTSKFNPDDPITLTKANFTIPVAANYTVRFKRDGTILFGSGQDISDFHVGDEVTIQATMKLSIENEYTINGTYTILEVQPATATTPASIRVNTTWSRFYDYNGDSYDSYGSTGGISPLSPAVIIRYAEIGLNLNGTYRVLAVDAKTIVLDYPSKVNPEWLKLSQFANQTSPDRDVTLKSIGLKWVGPFTVNFPNFSWLTLNFVATQGLYIIGTDDNRTQWPLDIDLQVEVQQVENQNGVDVAVGPVETFTGTVKGSAYTRRQRALTLDIHPSWAKDKHLGRCTIRVARTTARIYSQNTIVDDIQWRDLYACAVFPANTNLGDLTLVRSRTLQTTGALAVKERRLNMLVQRKLPRRVSGSVFTTELYPTNNAADIISAICLDPHIGARKHNEIDFDNIYTTIANVKSYFNNQDVCVQFCYTFDNGDISFEDTVASAAKAVFCMAYRRGSLIRLTFEARNPDSSILFNHRNKLPGSETRTVRFGNEEGCDGVELDYISPLDDSKMTFRLPEDGSAVNPKKIETIGIRSRIQAHYHAWRAWNKIRYQNISVEFEATQEAELLLIWDRILVADNTRPETQDGEIVSADGLTLTLSQPIK